MLPDVVSLDVLLDMLLFDDLDSANEKLADYHLKAVLSADRERYEIVSILGGRPIATIGANQPIITIPTDTQYVSSTSDDRTANNVMRHEYRVLSQEEKEQMGAVKDMGLRFWNLLDNLGNSRELSLAKTKVEEAVFWAIKNLTK